MKILRILLILLVPALGIVSCKKSDMTPGKCSSQSHSSVKEDSNTNEQVSAGRGEEVLGQDNNTTVVGSGDDDRDGGDKKQKKTAGK